MTNTYPHRQQGITGIRPRSRFGLVGGTAGQAGRGNSSYQTSERYDPFTAH